MLSFRLHNREYRQATAVEIVRSLARDACDYPGPEGALRQFLRWSLAQFAGQIHQRELALADRVSEELLAFSYLCLLDEYGLGQLVIERRIWPEKVETPEPRP